MTKIKNILFVCHGNTARSPVAWALARSLKEKYPELSDVNFDSAGFINAFSYMQPESRYFLDLKGVDHSDFVPKILNRDLIAKQDLILTMETIHKEKILHDHADIKNIKSKVFTLKEFNGVRDNLNIIDPYYENPKTYMKIMRIIEQQVTRLMQRLLELNKET